MNKIQGDIEVLSIRVSYVMRVRGRRTSEVSSGEFHSEQRERRDGPLESFGSLHRSWVLGIPD